MKDEFLMNTTNTHPLANAVVWTVTNDLNLLPQNTIPAPAPDLRASLDCKHQQDDEGYEHQEAKDNSYGLQESHDIFSGLKLHPLPWIVNKRIRGRSEGGS